MSSLAIRAASPADAEALFQIHYDALGPFNELYGAFRKVDPRDAMAIATRRALGDPSNMFLVAEEKQTGEVVGFVRWIVVDPEAEKEAELQAQKRKMEGKSEDEKPAENIWAVKEELEELWDKFNEREDEMDTCYEKAHKGQRHGYIRHLMVSPSHQRKGIGGVLLDAALNQISTEKLPTFLVSSSESYGLYAKMGFESLGRWTVDDGVIARELVKTLKEKRLSDGADGTEGMEERYRGVVEEEHYMVRW